MSAEMMCPVCGYLGLHLPPRDSDGVGNYDICRSCGFEFGVSDDDEGYTYETYRAEWIARGMSWWAGSIQPPPEGWDPDAQLRNLDAD